MALLSSWKANTKRILAKDKNTGTEYEFESAYPDGSPDGTPFSAAEMNKIIDAVNGLEQYKGALGTTSLDNYKTSGVYAQTVSSYATSSRGYPVTSAGTLIVIASGSTTSRITQVYLVQSSNEIYYRRYVSSAWTDWVQLYPGVISGSNSNGRYIKYPDGTMICWCNGSKSVMSTGGITVTFPEAFVDNTYSAHANAINLSNCLATCDNTSASSTNVWMFKATDGTTPSTGTSVNYSVMAVGRWK